MGLVLNLETATTVCSVALARDGQVISFREINQGYTHAENLTVFIRQVMDESGIGLPSIDAVAVSKGPGSYTGLRIGVAAAKGLCFSLDKPLVAVSTLQSMANQIMKQKTYKDVALLCPLLDARRMEVYCALYNQQLEEIQQVNALILDEQSFSDVLHKQSVLFFGDGSNKLEPLLKNHPHARFAANIFPSAVSMISLSESAYQKKLFENTAYFEPFYLKDFIVKK